MGQKVEVAFMNEQYENNKQAVFGWDQRTATSGVSWNTSKAYYQEGEYIYINVYTINITDGNAQFHFSLKKDVTNPQPIYTKAVTISNKQNITLKPADAKTFTYAVDTYCTKKIELISDDPTVAEVVADGAKQFKIIAKGPGKTTIRVKDVSGSNLEDSLEVTVNP
ncbi:pilus assembly protein N-terminal domain-containing protein [Candidatus Enterococcus clewellii]|nr:pilus assembly protein N-terminal domain-containing protein [Enterococcus sp. 9E7_DIV0242]